MIGFLPRGLNDDIRLGNTQSESSREQVEHLRAPGYGK